MELKSTIEVKNLIPILKSIWLDWSNCHKTWRDDRLNLHWGSKFVRLHLVGEMRLELINGFKASVKS